MQIYFLLLFWSIITSFIYIIFKNNINKIFLDRIYYLINYVPMGIIAGIRNVSVGTDTKMYHEFFYRYGILDFDWNYFDYDKVEIGYRLLNKIIYFFTSESNICIFIISFFLIMGFGYFILVNSVNIWMSTFLFIGIGFYTETYNTVRQSIACMIMCNAYYFLKTQNMKKWILSIFFAMCFHSTAVIFFIFTLLMKINKMRINIVVSLGILFYLIIVYGLDLFLEIFTDFKYGYYIVNNEISIGADILRIILFALVIIFFIYNRKYYYRCGKNKDIILLGIFLFYAMIMSIAKYQIEIFYRLVQYFSPYIVISIPLVIMYLKKGKYILYPIVIIITIVLLYYLLMKNDSLYYSTFVF